MAQRGRSPVGAGRGAAPGLAPLIPVGEPIERVLRKAQFFTAGKPPDDYREAHCPGAGDIYGEHIPGRHGGSIGKGY